MAPRKLTRDVIKLHTKCQKLPKSQDEEAMAAMKKDWPYTSCGVPARWSHSLKSKGLPFVLGCSTESVSHLDCVLRKICVTSAACSLSHARKRARFQPPQSFTREINFQCNRANRLLPILLLTHSVTCGSEQRV